MSNLPPGVTESNIPGNRPEDVEWDKFFVWFTDFADTFGINPAEAKEIVEAGMAAKGWVI
jgi:hypothetical protein